MTDSEKPTPPSSKPSAILIRLSDYQGEDLAAEALRLTALEGRRVSATEVARRRLFGIGKAA